MPMLPTARELLDPLVGATLLTVSGRENRVLAVRDEEVLVATERSPGGQPVPLAWIQRGLDQLAEAGEVEVSTDALEHRSAFVAAVLMRLPGAHVIDGAPARIRLGAEDAYRAQAAGS